MARTLTPDSKRAGIALAAFAMVIFLGGSFGQIAAIAMGAGVGLRLCQDPAQPISGLLNLPVSRASGLVALMLFVVLLLVPPMVAAQGYQGVKLFDAFYRSGALVFGGGHVVLPLLQRAIVKPGWVTANAFIAGYGVAQAVPGPLFTFSAYLGAVIKPAPYGIADVAIALIAIFLPGLLLVYGMLPFWDNLRSNQTAQAAMRGANAAVVGILAAAFYNPVWKSAILTPADLVLALAGFLALTMWQAPPWLVVLLLAATGASMGILGFA